MSESVYLSDSTNARPDVTRGWLTAYGLAYLGSCIGWAAPTQLLIGNQILVLRPDSYENSFALMLTLGGLSQVITTLFAGQLSDRTRSRIGRRLPWVLGGGAVCTLVLVAMSFTPPFAALVTAWIAFQSAMVFITNNLLTISPDTVPKRQFGLVSGVLGASYTLGLVLGTVVATVLSLQLAYVATAGIMIALLIQFALGRSRAHVVTMEREYGLRLPSVSDGATSPSTSLSVSDGATAPSTPPSVADGAASPSTPPLVSDCDIPVREADSRAATITSPAATAPPGSVPERLGIGAYRDYLWVWAARFVVHIGNYVALFYLLYYLRDRIKLEDPDTGVLVLTVIYAACTVLTSIIGGPLSDRVGRRKIFVVVSSIAAGVAALILSVASDFTVVIAGAVLLGLAWGIFTAVDQALINEALPSEVNRARDMSWMTLTVGVTNMLAGAIAALALSVFGGYEGLYVMCGIICMVGSVLVLPVKGSK